jgi:hypothetical protein
VGVVSTMSITSLYPYFRFMDTTYALSHPRRRKETQWDDEAVTHKTVMRKSLLMLNDYAGKDTH